MSESKNQVAEAKPALASGGRIAPIVPTNFEQAYRLSQVLAASGMVPKAYKDKQDNANVEMICVGIMHGLELGLTPMAALQSIAVINGMPSLWGDGMLAVVQGSGLLEDIEETEEVDAKGDWQWSVCKMWRKGRKTPTVRQFTRVMAAKAGLLGKQGPWSQYPSRMGQMRARSWCARDAFPDLLRGMRAIEEAQDMVDVTDVGSVTTTAPEPRRTDFKPQAQKPAAQPDPEPETEREEPTWSMYEFTGEEGDSFYTAAQWVDAFTRAMRKADGDVRAGLLRANEDTVVDILARSGLSDEQKAGLRGFYTTGEQQPAAKNWALPENVVGQEAKLAGIYRMLEERTETTGDVEDLYEAHESFLAKLTGLKKSEASKRFSDRKILLGQRQAAE